MHGSIFNLDTSWGVVGQGYAPTALPPEKTWYPLGGPQGRSGQLRENSPHKGFDHRTFQPVTSGYTDYAIPVHTINTDTNLI